MGTDNTRSNQETPKMRKNRWHYAPIIIGALLLLTTCNKKQSIKTGMITVDVTKEYPKMEATPLQDITEVEYIALETTEEFLCDGYGRFTYVDDQKIIWYNSSNDDILIFNKAGKALKKINRRGQSGEEFPFKISVLFDNENEEFYVLSQPKIFVYDLNGNYKRSFLHDTGDPKYPMYYGAIYNFNKEYLLCFRNYNFDKDVTSFLLISKQTGEKIKDISIPFDKLIDNYLSSADRGSITNIYTVIKSAVSNGNHSILNESSSDTIYLLEANLSLNPIITRTPSIQQMEIPIFLGVNTETDRYFFMTKVKKGEFPNFQSVPLVYDKHTGEIQEPNFYNSDDLSKKPIHFSGATDNIRAIDHNRYYLSLPAYQLKEAYENNELQGELKKIASKITEDDNPVLMLVKFKY
jgi:hypothetical protein